MRQRALPDGPHQLDQAQTISTAPTVRNYISSIYGGPTSLREPQFVTLLQYMGILYSAVLGASVNLSGRVLMLTQ